MSDFTPEGFAPFPNIYEDEKHVRDISELTEEGLDFKTNEYGAFLQREDIMARARIAGNRILDHLLFEMAYRDGIYSQLDRLEEDYSECL